MKKERQYDPKNCNLKFPKGPNSRSQVNKLKESFQRVVPEELEQWKNGNYDNVVQEKSKGSVVAGNLSECVTQLTQRLVRTTKTLNENVSPGVNESADIAIDELNAITNTMRLLAEKL